MQDSSTFDINKLTNEDEQYWRVDWFGYLDYIDHHGQRRSEPLIEVFLSPFKKRPNPGCLNYKDSTDFDNPNVVQVPVSYLRLLRLGDVWRHGERIPIRHSQEMLTEFKGLRIDKSTTSTMPAGATDKLGHYIIPFRYHPYHKQSTKTYCEVINLSNGNLIVVPHVVILQAYLSSCQYVFQQMFKYGFQWQSIYDPSESFITSEGNAFVLLKQKVHDVAAAEVARLAFDTHANRVFSAMSEIFSVQLNRKEPIRPKISFPFQGQTDLSVFGKWCWLDRDKTREAFIVYEILSCTAELPFKYLEFFRDNPGDEGSDDAFELGNDSGGRNKPKPKQTGKKKLNLKPDEEPTNQTGPLELEGRQGAMCTDLVGKEVKKVRQKQHKDRHSRRKPQEEVDVDAGNTGDGEARGLVAPVDFLPPESRRHVFSTRVCRLELFRELLREILLKQRVENVEYLQAFPTLGADSGVYSFFPKTFTASGRLSTWQYINYLKGVTPISSEGFLHRRAIAVKLELSSGKEVLLIEAERRTCEIEQGWIELDYPSMFLVLSNKGNSVTTYQLSKLLENCVENRGVWNSELISGSHCAAVSHAQAETIATGDYVTKQIEFIENHLGFSLS